MPNHSGHNRRSLPKPLMNLLKFLGTVGLVYAGSRMKQAFAEQIAAVPKQEAADLVAGSLSESSPESSATLLPESSPCASIAPESPVLNSAMLAETFSASLKNIETMVVVNRLEGELLEKPITIHGLPFQGESIKCQDIQKSKDKSKKMEFVIFGKPKKTVKGSSIDLSSSSIKDDSVVTILNSRDPWDMSESEIRHADVICASAIPDMNGDGIAELVISAVPRIEKLKLGSEDPSKADAVPMVPETECISRQDLNRGLALGIAITSVIGAASNIFCGFSFRRECRRGLQDKGYLRQESEVEKRMREIGAVRVGPRAWIA